MGTRSRGIIGILGAAIPLALSAPDALSQESERVVPTHQTVITGYGTVGYAYETQGTNENAFTGALNPIFLFQFQDRVLFEAELEFSLEGGITETGLEYAQLDFIANDNLVLVGGKFLLPFGVFSERLHPTWINKFPTAPPIYGHHVAAFGALPLLPILSDLGFMVRGTVRPGPFNITLNAYVTQGPAAEDPAAAQPELTFLASSEDNNTDKMIGGRLDIAFGQGELNFSFLNGDYDEDDVLDLTGWNIAGEYRTSGFEVRGEYLQTRTEIETFTGFPELKRHCFYGQASYRWRNWEPVFRWTQVFDDKLDGQVQEEGAWQAGVGFDYWFSPSIALMAGYEINREDGVEVGNDRFVFHIAYGF